MLIDKAPALSLVTRTLAAPREHWTGVLQGKDGSARRPRIPIDFVMSEADGALAGYGHAFDIALDRGDGVGFDLGGSTEGAAFSLDLLIVERPIVSGRVILPTSGL